MISTLSTVANEMMHRATGSSCRNGDGPIGDVLTGSLLPLVNVDGADPFGPPPVSSPVLPPVTDDESGCS